MRRVIALLAAVGAVLGLALGVGSASTHPAGRPWLTVTRPLDQRVDGLLAAMTLPEKAQLLYGVEHPTGGYSVGYVRGVPRLGIPPLVLSDGPAGVKDTGDAPSQRPATALPAPAALAASFDPELARQYGSVLGHEATTRGVDVLYGPAINIVRVPQGGRNFEYLGEDPVLTSQLASAEVAGIQSWRIAAQVKHFALNNQENGRHDTSSDADERTMREIYLPAWRATATGAGRAWSLMCANNLVDGTYACENDTLLNGIVKGEWGYDGVVGSDYAAVPSATGAAAGGLDQDFTLRDWGEWYSMLPDLVQRGVVPVSEVDDHARRVLTMMFRIGMFDHKPPAPPVDQSADGAVAREAAEESTVLLKNSGELLPLDPAKTHSIAVVGRYAGTALTGGGGSSRVTPYYSVSPVAGIQKRAGAGVKVTTADGSDPSAAAALASAADVAVVVVNDVETEGADRADIGLPDDQDALVDAVAAANPHTVVVLDTGSAVTMPWLDSVPSVLQAWYPGEEGGTALAAILFGDVDPSGKLPVTFPTDAAQSPTAGPPRYPAEHGRYLYSEGLDVGYRGYDAAGSTPLFPFGYGLSYTTFAYSGLSVGTFASDGSVDVRATVTNTGTRPGTDVAQLYLGCPPAAGEPPRSLKTFERVTLGAGASRQLTFHLSRGDFQTWDVRAHAWGVGPGDYTVWVGDSSRDLPLHANVTLGDDAGAQGLSLHVPAILPAGSTARVSATVTNDSGQPLRQVPLQLSGPEGWSSQMSTVDTVPAHGRSTVTWRLPVPAGAKPGPAAFTMTSPHLRTARATGQLPYPDLAGAFNEVGVTADGDTSLLADMYGDLTYSKQGLAAAGWTAGGRLSHDGLAFRLPKVASGQFDNAAGMGQVVRVPAAVGDRLGLLTAGVWGAQAGTVTVTYTDGTTQTTRFETPDWQAKSGTAAATTGYVDNVLDGSKEKQQASVFFGSVPLQPGRTVAYVTLPTSSRFHLFSLKIGL